MPVLLWSAGASVVVALLAGLGDRRRQHRADLDRVGWWDWRTLQLVALLATAVLVSLAVHLR